MIAPWTGATVYRVAKNLSTRGSMITFGRRKTGSSLIPVPFLPDKTLGEGVQADFGQRRHPKSRQNIILLATRIITERLIDHAALLLSHSPRPRVNRRNSWACSTPAVS